MERLEGIIGEDLSDDEVSKLLEFEYILDKLRKIEIFKDFKEIVETEFPIGSWVEYRRQIGSNIFLRRYEIIGINFSSKIITRPDEEIAQNQSEISDALLWNRNNFYNQKPIPKMKGYIKSFDGKPFDATLYLHNDEYPPNSCRAEVVDLFELNHLDLGQAKAERRLTDYLVRSQK